MAGFRWAKFVGSFPSKPARLMDANEMLAVSNTQLDRGTLRPYPASTHEITPVNTTRSFYYYRDPDDAQPAAWLVWDDFDVSVAASPIVNDTYDRVYWTGDTSGPDSAGRAKVASRDDILGTFVGPYPEGFYFLGVPPVTTTPTAVRTIGAEPDPSLASSYSYVVTYVSAYGEEGPSSVATDIIDVDDSEEATFEVTVTVPFEGGVDTNRSITHIRLYCVYAGTDEDDWKMVKEQVRLDAVPTVITHEVPIADLSIPLVSTTWEVPPTDMRGMKAFGSGLIGFSKNELCMSEAGFGHAWPPGYRLPTDSPITGIGVYGNTIFIGTMSSPHIAYGHLPEQMTIERLNFDQACVGQASVVEMDEGVVFASPTGLHLVGSSGIKTLTDDIWSREDFAALEPTTIRASRWGSVYVFQCGSTTKTMYALYPKHPERGVVELTAQDAHAFHYDAIADKLYYYDQALNTIREMFDLAAADQTMAITTGSYVSAHPTNMAWMQVQAYSYPLTVSLYTNSNTGDTFELVGGAQTVTDRNAFRLPSGYLATAFYCVVSSNDEIESIVIAESANDLRKVP
jgi:hypothetical protein